MKTYYNLYKTSKEKIVGYRMRLVKYALDQNISKAAKEFDTTRKTVRKWINRYDSNNPFGSLSDMDKTPHNIVESLTDGEKSKLKGKCKLLKKNNKRIIGSNILRDLKLSISLPTMNKYLIKFGFKERRKSKRERRRNLVEYKKRYKPFERIQVDIKYLDDIPEFYKEYYIYNLPKYQITARCVKTGSLFYGYAREKTATNTAIFIYKLLNHLKTFNISVKEILIQTDNGREFRNLKGEKISKFQDIISEFQASYRSIFPGAKTWQSDVESSHRLIEDEFYAYQIFGSRTDFFDKANKYQQYFNKERYNNYKGNTPLQILKNDIKNSFALFTIDNQDYLLDKIDKIYNFKVEVMDEHITTIFKF